MGLPPRRLSPVEQAVKRLGSLEAFLKQFTPEERKILLYDWEQWAKPLQQIDTRTYRGQVAPPGNWFCWLILAGRGYGKTRTGSEWCIKKAMDMPGSRGALITGYHHDTVKIAVEGESGLIARSPPWFRAEYLHHKRLVRWPNGSTANLFSAECPDDFRGLQHHWALADEIAKPPWDGSVWDQLLMTMRLPPHPQILAVTTPKRLPWLKALKEAPTTVLTIGTTWENATNLPKIYLDELHRMYDGTTLGRQELEGELFTDVPGALWRQGLLDAHRVEASKVPKLNRVVVGVDPSDSSKKGTEQDGHCEAGIIVAGVGMDGRYYVLEDGTCRETPEGWARRAIELAVKWHTQDIVAESNRGGMMVASVITLSAKNSGANVKPILKKAVESKVERAEPISALYEQGKVSHAGIFAELEGQLTSWTPDQKSPDRLDALVYALGDLAFPVRRGAVMAPRRA